MEQIECAGGIVVGPDRQILVITNQLGKLTFPKGRREEGETRIGTARREIREESGVTNLTIVRFLGVITRAGFTAEKGDVPSVEKQIYMFHCLTPDVELLPMPGEATEAHWFEPGRVPHVLTWPEEAGFFLKHLPALGSEQ